MVDGNCVSIVEPVGGHGGMYYYDFGLCEGLVAAGLDAVLYTCDETHAPPNSSFAVRHTYNGIYGRSPALIRGVRFVIGSLRMLVSSVMEGRKIVHFHYFHVGPLELMNVIFARLAIRKVIITAHDVESFVSSLEVSFMSRLTYRMAHHVIAHNTVSRQELIDHIGLPEKRISVIQHGNYLHAIEPLPKQEDARKALGISRKGKVILFFGLIREGKGLDLLLQAMPAVLEAYPETLLLIAGRSWKCDFTIYEAQMERLNIRNRCITHIRYIPDEDVSLYYAAADLVVLPYRKIYQSGVLLMAMSYSKAVLVSDLPGMTEIITDSVNGLVFRQGDAKDLAKKLIEAFGNMQIVFQLAKKGYSYVHEKCDWNFIGNKTKELYASINS